MPKKQPLTLPGMPSFQGLPRTSSGSAPLSWGLTLEISCWKEVLLAFGGSGSCCLAHPHCPSRPSHCARWDLKSHSGVHCPPCTGCQLPAPGPSPTTPSMDLHSKPPDPWGTEYAPTIRAGISLLSSISTHLNTPHPSGSASVTLSFDPFPLLTGKAWETKTPWSWMQPHLS